MIRPRPARLRYAAHVALVLWTALIGGWLLAELTAPLILSAYQMEMPR